VPPSVKRRLNITMLVKIMSVIFTGVSNIAMNVVPGCTLVAESFRATAILLCLSLF
jgi:hypothetical protein